MPITSSNYSTLVVCIQYYYHTSYAWYSHTIYAYCAHDLVVLIVCIL